MIKNKVKKLYAIGHAKWYNLFKPVWNWLANRKAEKKLEHFLKNNLNESASIMELGCGTALNLKKILSLNLRFKRYLGLDFSDDMLAIAKKNFNNVEGVEFRHQDLTKLHNVDEKFDVIISTWVLSHLPHPADVINQAQTYLKPGGKMFLIFLSEPKWYIRFWFSPLAKSFYSKLITKDEIKKFHNVKLVKHYAGNLTTLIEINKSS